jgi:hypothetical protein
VWSIVRESDRADHFGPRLDRRRTKAASPYTEFHDSQAYFWAHREVMPKARHVNSVSF